MRGCSGSVKSETFEIKFEPVKAAYSEIGISFILFLPWSSFLFHMFFSLISFFFLLPHQSTKRPWNQISPQFPVGWNITEKENSIFNMFKPMTNTGNLERIADSRMLKYKNNFCCFELPLYFCASHGNFEALFVFICRHRNWNHQQILSLLSYLFISY